MPAAATETPELTPEQKRELDARKSFAAHAEGCPAGLDRVETYTNVRPSDRMVMRIIRCQTCGGQSSKSTGKESTSDE